jgi:deoxyribonuclease-1
MMQRFFSILCMTALFAAVLLPQSIVTNPDTLRFQTTLTTVTDSLPVWIRNASARAVSITDINIYSDVYAVRDTAFSLKPGDSVRTWVRFSSLHNLTFPSLLFIETDLISGSVTVPVTGTKAYAEALYASTQGKSGALLKTALTTIASTGHTALGYNTARDRMYGIIDNVGGQVECIYTGRVATFNTRTGATANNFNCEHTWPQSKFSEADPMVSDINHLFPSDEAANSKRSNFPFGVVTSASWTVGGSKYGSGYGGQTVFEPRDEHKGDCARAMLYFITRYPNNYGSFWSDSPYQEAAFRDWNKRFPPTAKSKARNNGVQQYQGNRNPFIDHPEFVERIASFTGAADLPQRSILAASPMIVSHSKRAPGQSLGWSHTFANLGTVPLTVTSALFSDPAYSLAENIPQIAPGTSVRIGVNYQPTVATVDSVATLTLTYNDGTAVKQFIVTLKAQTNGVLAVGTDAIVPAGFALQQNFPNPFNPSTTIRYSLPPGNKQHVVLRIYDALGKEVRTVVDAQQDGGEHAVSVSMEGSNSGVYFYRLQAGATILSRSMLLLK